MKPVDVLRLSPLGKLGLTLYVVYVPEPPAAVTGLNDVTGNPLVTVTVALVAVAVIVGLTMAKLNDWLLVCDMESVAFTVKLVADNNAVGVPVMKPLVLPKDNPLGNVGVMLNDMLP